MVAGHDITSLSSAEMDAVRRKLGLLRDFSLCVEEIGFLVRPTPGGHRINYRAARALVACLRHRGILPRGEEE